MENSRNKQLISFKLHTILSRVMKSHAIPLHLPRIPNHQHHPDLQPSTSSLLNDPGSPKADDPPSDISSEGLQQPNATPQSLRLSSHFLSSHRHFILWFLAITSSQGWVQYNKIFWERDYIHITFNIVYCYNCSILLLLLIFYCA